MTKLKRAFMYLLGYRGYRPREYEEAWQKYREDLIQRYGA